MQTQLDPRMQALPRAAEAERILRSCVHCGFCNATCPTYQLLGDELDGPRGRIYQIKELLEGAPVTTATQQHLDRCLSCRNCETTCPSGVQYHHLLDIGREVLDTKVPRSTGQRLLRGTLRRLMTRPSLFALLLGLGRLFRPLLPAVLRDKVPASPLRPGALPARSHARKVLMLEGCVQPAMSPNTNAATARVLDRLGIEVIRVSGVRCCGAVDYHLDAQADGLDHARRNIDAWWPTIESGAEAIVQNASGCGAFVRDYGHLLAGDPKYAERARRVSALALDLVEVIAREPLQAVPGLHEKPMAFHCPCTLRHVQKLGPAAEALLKRLGFTLTAVPDAHLCCGSAGTYSITQPELSHQLRDNKLQALMSEHPEAIVTANVGCQAHLAAGAGVPVRHWIEMVDQALSTHS